jgi:crotonobetainyl-CoA:carnitine CoA-transferase CaiB-like acyl-CoA transferase
MGREDLIGREGWDSKVERAKRIGEVDAVIEGWLTGRPKADVVETLLDANVPCAPVRTVGEMVEDPHLRERGMLHDLPNPGEGREETPVPGMPIKFAGDDAPEPSPAPALGEHTEAVLREVAGYSEAELDRLDGVGAPE